MKVCIRDMIYKSRNLIVSEDHIEVVKYLVSVGADKSVKGPDGNTAAEAADNQDLKELLL